MEISVDKVTLTLDQHEASIVAYAIAHDIERSIKDHWSRFTYDKFTDDYGARNLCKIMRKLFEVIGRAEEGYTLLTKFEKWIKEGVGQS